MTTNPKSLHFYSRIFDNFDILKGAAILSDERIEEIKQYCSKDNFKPTILQDGRKLDNWYTHIPSGKVFAQTLVDSTSYYWLCNKILEDFLTDEEIEKLNQNASARYSEIKEKERFEKANKINESEWNGLVFLEGYGYNDGYFSSIEDFYDQIANDEEENGEEFSKPLYLWACNARPSCHIDLDSILENASENAHEDLKGLDELRVAVDKFNKLNKDQVSWEPDFKTAVLLNK